MSLPSLTDRRTSASKDRDRTEVAVAVVKRPSSPLDEEREADVRGIQTAA